MDALKTHGNAQYPTALPNPEELRELDFSLLQNDQDENAGDGVPEEIQVLQEEIFEAAKTDMDLLASLAMPDVYKYAFPAIYAMGVWVLITGLLGKVRDFSQLALGLPRGFGKTLVVKLAILYAILYTKKRFILVISESEDKAISIISDVMDMLGEPNIKAVYGDWSIGKQSDNSKKKVFTFRGRSIILKPAGNKTSIRGITEKNMRPDMMVFDDIQDRDGSESLVLSKQLERWMYGTAMKAKSPEGCLFLFIANMYPTKGSLLRRIKANPQWIKFIVGGILSDGTSLWEDLQPIKQLVREFHNDLAAGQPEIFYAEVLNDENASVNGHIDLSQVPPYPYIDEDIPVGSFIVIDPATDKHKADSVTVGGYNIFDAIPVLRNVEEGAFSPGKTIQVALQMALEMGASLIVVEGNAYQYSLKYWMDLAITKLGITGITVVPIYSGSAAKTTRILTMFKALIAGEVIVHPDVKAVVHNQILQYNPLKRDNIDGILDVLTYPGRIMAEFPDLIHQVIQGNVIEVHNDDIGSDTETASF